MLKKNVQEIVDGLSEEEKEQFKDLIKESFEREVAIATATQESQKALAELQENFEVIIVNLKKSQAALVELKEELIILNAVLKNQNSNCLN
jgi:4-hydroxy-3-methylbut-2-enyl diphosphate reductase IspH